MRNKYKERVKIIVKMCCKITSSVVEFIMKFPFILPMRMTPKGPSDGIFDTIRLAEVARVATKSASCFKFDFKSYVTYKTKIKNWNIMIPKDNDIFI